MGVLVAGAYAQSANRNHTVDAPAVGHTSQINTTYTKRQHGDGVRQRGLCPGYAELLLNEFGIGTVVAASDIAGGGWRISRLSNSMPTPQTMPMHM